MLTITYGALIIVAALSLVGLFHPAYHDNWLQHLGLIGLGVGAVLKMEQLHRMGFASAETMVIAVSMACFAVGTASKVRGHWVREHRNHSPGR